MIKGHQVFRFSNTKPNASFSDFQMDIYRRCISELWPWTLCSLNCKSSSLLKQYGIGSNNLDKFRQKEDSLIRGMNNLHQHRKCYHSPASNHQSNDKKLNLAHGEVRFVEKVRPMSILKLWVSSDVPKYLCLNPLYITPFYHRLWVQGNSPQ